VSDSPPRVAILGAGRVGRAFYGRLTEKKHPPVLLWTRIEATAEAARQQGFPATSGPLPTTPADIVLLAVSDPAVVELAAAVAAAKPGFGVGTVVAHMAGALDLTPLEPLRAAGYRVGSFHPIVSFASPRAELAHRYAAIAGASDDVLHVLDRLATTLEMKTIRPTGNRTRYHAAATLAGNFPQVLLEAAARLLKENGLSHEEAVAAFGPLLVSAARNAAELGPVQGLSGPVRRGDVEVVRRHLEVLATETGDLDALYRAASRVAVDLAESAGAPNSAPLREVLAKT
jgi:predicted short-subunit dehydrogenase-like oxidoreductase (DUF2520 family)